MKTLPSFQLMLLFFLVLSLSSCQVQNLLETGKHYPLTADSLAADSASYVLRVDDKVSISLWNHNDLSVGSVFDIYNSAEAYGKWELIDPEGNIQVPKVGKVHLAGLTLNQAADTLSARFAEFVVNPIVVVKVLNKEVTLLGEFNSPGNYLLEKEKNTLYEVIGKGSGFDYYADKKRVKLIRNNRQYVLNLTEMEEYEINNISVLPGDMIIAPAKNGKALDKKAPTLISVASIITAVVILFTSFGN
ncbi:polysaccharide biosynthesis/export family protein [bacterium SCSIO 12741]|nr:polysaccharide biosynthesis/export family protein [bacterium SCSIO 12741]